MAVGLLLSDIGTEIEKRKIENLKVRSYFDVAFGDFEYELVFGSFYNTFIKIATLDVEVLKGRFWIKRNLV